MWFAGPMEMVGRARTIAEVDGESDVDAGDVGVGGRHERQ